MVVTSTVTTRSSSDIPYTEHKYRKEPWRPVVSSHWIWAVRTQPETTILSITAWVRIHTAALVEESNRVTEMGRKHNTHIPKECTQKMRTSTFEGKSPLRRPRYGKEFCTLMEHEMPQKGLQWSHLTHVVSSGVGFNMLKNVDIPYNKFPD